MDWNISFDNDYGVNNTNIVVGTTAPYAYNLYLAKRRQIEELEYECDLLIDKYHAEMCNANIPPQFAEGLLDSLFDENEETRRLARKHFLELCFSDEFLKKFEVEFVNHMKHGYGRTACTVILCIGDYDYSVEIPLPKNINKKDDKTRLVGQVQFRVDRLLKAKREEFFKVPEPVQMPTYDWKECFTKIEDKVMEEFVKGNEKRKS